MLPALDPAARAHCRSVCGEMHSGFAALRSALPVNLQSTKPGFAVWSAARADIDRILKIWHECFARYGGPAICFGKKHDDGRRDVRAGVHTVPQLLRRARPGDGCLLRAHHDPARAMIEWIEAAKLEPEEMPELDAEF